MSELIAELHLIAQQINGLRFWFLIFVLLFVLFALFKKMS